MQSCRKLKDEIIATLKNHFWSRLCTMNSSLKVRLSTLNSTVRGLRVNIGANELECDLMELVSPIWQRARLEYIENDRTLVQHYHDCLSTLGKINIFVT